MPSFILVFFYHENCCFCYLFFKLCFELFIFVLPCYSLMVDIAYSIFLTPRLKEVCFKNRIQHKALDQCNIYSIHITLLQKSYTYARNVFNQISGKWWVSSTLVNRTDINVVLFIYLFLFFFNFVCKLLKYVSDINCGILPLVTFTQMNCTCLYGLVYISVIYIL